MERKIQGNTNIGKGRRKVVQQQKGDVGVEEEECLTAAAAVAVILTI